MLEGPDARQSRRRRGLQVSACTQVQAREGRRREGKREGGQEGGRESIPAAPTVGGAREQASAATRHTASR